jgi:hypothetical protein
MPGNLGSCPVADRVLHNIIMTAQNDQLQYKESRRNWVRRSKSLALGRESPRRIDSIIPWSFISLHCCQKYLPKARLSCVAFSHTTIFTASEPKENRLSIHIRFD